MTRTFKRYTLAEFITVLRQHVGKVKFSEVHVHATWKPTISDFRRSGGLKLQQAMQRAHMQRGFSDIAQHVTIDPDGYIWEGRPLTVAPASATGYNDGDNDGLHPFMFEMIGNFDRGHEQLEGEQLETTLCLIRAIMSLFGVPLKRVRFHRDMTSLKTCPGSGINKAEFMRRLQQEVNEVRKEDANGIIRYLQAAWSRAESKTEKDDIHRLANIVRDAGGIPKQ